MVSSRLKIWSVLFWLACGLCVGVFATLTLLPEDLVSFNFDFFFWASLLMTVVSFALTVFSIWQYLRVDAERKKGDAQVKIWMEQAGGLHRSLVTVGINAITTDSDRKYSTVNDVGLAVYTLSDTAKALYQSLYEERCVTEEEYAKQQKEIGDATHKQRLENILKNPERSSSAQ